jgi:hypothetical protein
LRHLRAEHGEKVGITVVSVGEDPGLVSSYLRRERLFARVLRLSEDDYQEAFSGASTPALYVINRSRIDDVFSDSTWADGSTPGTRSFKAVVNDVVRRTGETPSID